jgi:hypothetical protein
MHISTPAAVNQRTGLSAHDFWQTLQSGVLKFSKLFWDVAYSTVPAPTGPFAGAISGTSTRTGEPVRAVVVWTGGGACHSTFTRLVRAVGPLLGPFPGQTLAASLRA